MKANSNRSGQSWLDKLLGTPADANGVAWVDVASSNVAAIGYVIDRDELHVRFLKPNSSGHYCYKYDGVPATVFRAFLNAGSKGTFLWRSIRNWGTDNLYPHTSY